MDVKTEYVDRSFRGTTEDYYEILKTTKTLYVGNLSFYTTESQIYELFAKCGDIQRIIMGVHRFVKTTCGFCFVIYYERKAAENAMCYINGTILDQRIIRVDWDVGFREGRQYGRGHHGGQVREEFRTNYDPERGGFGYIMHKKLRQAILQRKRQIPCKKIGAAY